MAAIDAENGMKFAAKIDDRSIYSHGEAVTPDDNTDLSHVSLALYVGVGGSVVADLLGGEAAVTFFAVPAGYVLPIRATRILQASTATGLVNLY
jgi:hypothetical protein